MNNKKDEKPTGTAAAESTGDPRYQLSLKQLHNYTDRLVDQGHAEYNKSSVLVKSKHPMDECLKRGIIEQQHHDSAKRIRNYRDCALSKLSGRTYNATGEGDPEMDAGTVYVIVMRTMRRRDWELITLVCFTEPNIDGNYFTEQEYSYLLHLAPNIKHAFEASDTAFSEARGTVKHRIEEERRRLEEIQRLKGC
jgi:hypothetical protein